MKVTIWCKHNYQYIITLLADLGLLVCVWGGWCGSGFWWGLDGVCIDPASLPDGGVQTS